MNQAISRKTTCTTKKSEKKQELEEFIRRFSECSKVKQATPQKNDQ
jgi:hypothetical protein